MGKKTLILLLAFFVLFLSLEFSVFKENQPSWLRRGSYKLLLWRAQFLIRFTPICSGKMGEIVPERPLVPGLIKASVKKETDSDKLRVALQKVGYNISNSGAYRMINDRSTLFVAYKERTSNIMRAFSLVSQNPALVKLIEPYEGGANGFLESGLISVTAGENILFKRVLSKTEKETVGSYFRELIVSGQVEKLGWNIAPAGNLINIPVKKGTENHAIRTLKNEGIFTCVSRTLTVPIPRMPPIFLPTRHYNP